MDDALDELVGICDPDTDAPPIGIPTGFAGLDELLGGGLRPGLLHVLTGTAGIGTSTLALNLAHNAAIKQTYTTLLLSGQSPRNEVITRLLSAEARVALHLLRTGRLSEEDAAKIARRVKDIRQAPLYINDRPITAQGIRATCDRLIRNHGLRLVIIDGVNLYARPTAPETLWAAQARLSADIKRLAAETGLSVVVTTPTNRGPNNRMDPRPTLPDIASSSAYAADADVVIGVHREDAYVLESPRAGEADLLLMKNRYGPVATHTVAFQGHYARFVDLADEFTPPPRPPAFNIAQMLSPNGQP